ncbi:MAG: PaREP1 family protein [Metallosphaera sp.]
MQTLEVPNELARKINQIADNSRRRNYDVIIDLLLDRLDKEEGLDFLMKLTEDFETEGDELTEAGMLIEAGELYWRALSYLMKAVGLKLGFQVASYQDHYSLIEFLAYKLNKGSLIVSFVNAERLHGEFHPRPQNREEFDFRVRHLKSLLTELRNLIVEFQS